ncbi:MAG: nucleotidyltransferase domain-containing protein [Bacteroidetes bacterium]|nr:nucleotidyltransferase domain-containing protein [Bacteroidota bacterium]
MAPDNEIVRKIKQGVKETDADAQIILYGSRALGTARNDSDWKTKMFVTPLFQSIQKEGIYL